MKLVTYLDPATQRPTVGAVAEGRVVSLAAHFPDMVAFLAGGAGARETAARTVDAALRDPSGLRALSSVRLLAPVPRPASIRDFMVFEAHVLGSLRTIARMRGEPVEAVRVPPAWYSIPAYYKGNPASVVGPDAEVVWPSYSQLLDYELEFGIFIGSPGRDIPRDRAAGHIGGYTIFNDVSARDTQGEEMTLLLGPAKGKDFDTGNAMGPCLVTPDEIRDPYALTMVARVDGEEWSRGNSKDMHFRFEDLIAYVSRSETLFPGDFFGSGTVGGGCGLEHGRWLRPGVTIELEVEGLGILRNRIVKP